MTSPKDDGKIINLETTKQHKFNKDIQMTTKSKKKTKQSTTNVNVEVKPKMTPNIKGEANNRTVEINLGMNNVEMTNSKDNKITSNSETSKQQQPKKDIKMVTTSETKQQQPTAIENTELKTTPSIEEEAKDKFGTKRKIDYFIPTA